MILAHLIKCTIPGDLSEAGQGVVGGLLIAFLLHGAPVSPLWAWAWALRLRPNTFFLQVWGNHTILQVTGDRLYGLAATSSHRVWGLYGARWWERNYRSGVWGPGEATLKCDSQT